MLCTQVDPESFIDTANKLPAHGRGAWNSVGKANGSWRYEYIKGKPNIGTNAEVSLDAWATCAGSYGYQLVLVQLGYLRPLSNTEKGIYGPATMAAVKKFQGVSKDPETGKPLDVDGTIGTSDARALLTPVIDAAEKEFSIANHYLRGETNLESALDMGALGYYIYYPDYRGVDRSCSQINSSAQKQVTWLQAFGPYYAIRWSAGKMYSYYDAYRRAYPSRGDDVLWDAALCSHNNPSAGQK